MDGGDRLVRRRKSLKERLSFKRINCCGATWGLVPTTISVRDDDDDDEVVEVPQTTEVTEEAGAQSPPGNSEPLCAAAETPTGSGMNLAAALAAERQYRGVQDPDGEGQGQSQSESQSPVAASTPLMRMSLMRLLEETDGCEGGEMTVTEMEKNGTGSDGVCCVCMGRKKGAAFIPCGHTFCRVCSREMWLNRGSCPLCNRSILEILDIY